MTYLPLACNDYPNWSATSRLVPGPADLVFAIVLGLVLSADVTACSATRERRGTSGWAATSWPRDRCRATIS